MSSFSKDMQQFDGDWDEQQEQAQSYNVMPDGIQQATIKICRVEQASFDPQPWQWSILFANEDGSVWRNLNLEDEKGREFAAKDAKTLGYTGPLSGLEEACASGMFDDKVCEVKVETKPGDKRDFTNVYIRRVYGTAPPAAEDADFQPSAADDDIPF